MFVAARLLVADRDPATREPTVEVAHEALLTRWSRLVGWVDEDRRWLGPAAAPLGGGPGLGRWRPSPTPSCTGASRLEAAIEALDIDGPGRCPTSSAAFVEAARHARDAEVRRRPANRGAGSAGCSARRRRGARRRARRRGGGRRAAPPGRRQRRRGRGAGRSAAETAAGRGADRGPRRSRRVTPPDPARHRRAARRRGLPPRRHRAYPLRRCSPRSPTPSRRSYDAHRLDGRRRRRPASCCPTASRPTSPTTTGGCAPTASTPASLGDPLPAIGDMTDRYSDPRRVRRRPRGSRRRGDRTSASDRPPSASFDTSTGIAAVPAARRRRSPSRSAAFTPRRRSELALAIGEEARLLVVDSADRRRAERRRPASPCRSLEWRSTSGRWSPTPAASDPALRRPPVGARR